MKKITRLKRNGTAVSTNRAEPCSCADTVGALLDARARRREPSRLGGPWLHVSALVNGECLRANLLAEREDIESAEKVPSAMRIVWHIGKAVEAYIREDLIELYGKENCLGLWTCSCKKSSYTGYGTDKVCKICQTRLDTYAEYNVKDGELRLSGSPDFMVRKPDGSLVIFELKSIKVAPKGYNNGAPEFNTLAAPQRGHALQLLMYCELMRRQGYEVDPEGLVGYCAKDFVARSPYKLYQVDSSLRENRQVVEALMDVSFEYATARKKGTLPPRIPLCPNCTSSRAKACPVSASCFSYRK
jgi:hypothetical protein